MDRHDERLEAEKKYTEEQERMIRCLNDNVDLEHIAGVLDVFEDFAYATRKVARLRERSRSIQVCKDRAEHIRAKAEKMKEDDPMLARLVAGIREAEGCAGDIESP